MASLVGGAERHAGERHLRRFLTGLGLAIVPLVSLVAVWWGITLVLDRARVFPPPALVATELIRILQGEGVLDSTYVHIAATLNRLLAAFAFSMVVGSVLGILAGRIPLLFDLIDNLVWVFMAVPSIVWVFIFAVGVGISEVVPVAAVSALLAPQILINVAEGTKSLPADLLEMGRSYKAGRRQMLSDVFLPYLVPYFAASARVAFALGIKLIVVAEVVGLSTGIGYEMKYWYDRLFMAPIVAWGFVMVAIGLIVDYGIFAPVERWAGRWKGRAVIELEAV